MTNTSNDHSRIVLLQRPERGPLYKETVARASTAQSAQTHRYLCSRTTNARTHAHPQPTGKHTLTYGVAATVWCDFNALCATLLESCTFTAQSAQTRTHTQQTHAHSPMERPLSHGVISTPCARPSLKENGCMYFYCTKRSNTRTQKHKHTLVHTHTHSPMEWPLPYGVIMHLLCTNRSNTNTRSHNQWQAHTHLWNGRYRMVWFQRPVRDPPWMGTAACTLTAQSAQTPRPHPRLWTSRIPPMWPKTKNTT